jgi:hypothetical protein
MANDAHDDPRTDAADAGGPPPSEQSAVRGAFLARQGQYPASGGGESEGEAGSASLRGAFLSRLTRETLTVRRTRSRVVTGSGTEETGGAVLRVIYAARTVTVAAPGRTRRGAKAVPAKKARPARIGAKKAAKKAAPKAARKAAPRRKARAAAPARRTKKAARKAARRR